MLMRARPLVPVAFLPALALLSLPSLTPAQISGGNTTPGPGNVPVRGSFDVTNNTGQTANDFEYCVRSKESFPINGFIAGAAPFTGGTSIGDVNNGICFHLDGGQVPPGGTITVNTTIFLPEENRIYVYDAAWTLNGDIIGRPPIPPGGWRVGNPTPGGNGGLPGLPGGQEGGGGAGNFIHLFTIDNDHDEPVTLHDLKLLASMNYYSNLRTDPPWAQVNPVDLGAPSIVIPANSSYSFAFQTTGDYFGGHVYSQYQVDFTYDNSPVPPRAPGDILNLTMPFFGDHPVTVPEPTTLTLYFGAAALVTLTPRRRPRT